jgi:hypothetical protein
VLLLAVVASSACGGAQPATKGDVVARANQICATAASAIRSLAPPASQSLRALSRYYRRVTPIVRTEVAQLRALPRPAQDRPLLARFLGAVERSARDFRRLAAAARAGDRDGFDTASAALRSSPASSLAARYGMKECGGSLGTSPA